MGYSGPGATNVTTTQPVTSISNTGQVSTGVNLTSNSTVNAIISAPPMTGPMATNTNNPVASAIAPVQTQMADGPMATSTPTPAQGPAESSPEQRSSTASNDGPATDSSTPAPAPRQSSTSTQSTPAPQQSNTQSAPAPSARQEIQAKREQAAKAQAVENGKNLANEMGKAASMEQQIAVQNVVLQAMGYIPGFAGYTKGYIPDVAGYKSYTAYANQKNVDNARLSRGLFGATDRLHNDMVESQYKEK
jgi:hypothetical protein